MDSEYWLQRWREGRTGWHRDAVMPLLEQHWPTLDVARDARVLVPLCGKTLDMPWLAAQGARVLGVELSPLAIESFLVDNHLRATTHKAGDGTHFSIGNPPAGGAIEIINADIFRIDPATLDSCTAFYDRAATIALPAPARARMASEVYARMPSGSRGLLIVLDYPQHQRQGPPFSVDEPEVHRLFDAGWKVERLEHRDILASQPGFVADGVTSLATSVYALTRQ